MSIEMNSVLDDVSMLQPLQHLEPNDDDGLTLISTASLTHNVSECDVDDEIDTIESMPHAGATQMKKETLLEKNRLLRQMLMERKKTQNKRN